MKDSVRNQKFMQAIIIMGPPGSGKGTQAELLRRKFGLQYVGTGELLRARAKRGDHTAKKLKGIMGRGERVPTPITFKIWMDKLESLKRNPFFKGFVWEGSPRSLLEAEVVDMILEWFGWFKNRKIIFLNISPRESRNRLTKRRMCTKCGRIIPYVGEFKKLKHCDKCGGRLVQRFDDSLKSINERLKWFKTDVLPAINYYQKKQQLIRIDGEQPIEKVFRDILKAIHSK